MPALMGSKSNKVVFIKLSAMGDMLCLLRSIRAFKKANPNKKAIVVTTSRSLPVFWQNVPFLDEVVILKANIFLPLQFLPVIKKIINSSFCVDFDQYYRISELLSLFSRKSFGFRTPYKGHTFAASIRYDTFMNESKQFYVLLKKACDLHSLPINKIKATIFEIDKKQKQGVLPDNQKAVFVYPGSGKNAMYRRWPIHKYIQVADFLVSAGHEVFFVGGKDESNLKEYIEMNGHRSLIDDLSLAEVADLLRHKCSLFVGNDGGLLHVADIMGVPIIGIFGPSLPSKWGSINKKSCHLEGLTSCRPCIRHDLGIVPKKCKYGLPFCLEEIESNDVISEIENYFGSRK